VLVDNNAQLIRNFSWPRYAPSSRAHVLSKRQTLTAEEKILGTLMHAHTDATKRPNFAWLPNWARGYFTGSIMSWTQRAGPSAPILSERAVTNFGMVADLEEW